MRTAQEREEHLRRIVGDDLELGAGLCLVNDLLGLKFPLHPRYANAEMSSRHVLSMHILTVLLRHFYPEQLVLFVVDDAHLMDPTCWDYLLYLSRSPAVLTLFGLRRNMAGSPKLADAITRIIYNNRNCKSIPIKGLESTLALPLACQMIEVAAIPVELERFDILIPFK